MLISLRAHSVVGDQQDFLCAKEAVMRASGVALRSRPPPAVLPAVGLDEVRSAVEATVRAVDRKHAAVRAAVQAAVALREATKPYKIAPEAADLLLRTQSTHAGRPSGPATPGSSRAGAEIVHPSRCSRADSDFSDADSDSSDISEEWCLTPAGGPAALGWRRCASLPQHPTARDRRPQSLPARPARAETASERTGRSGRPSSPPAGRK